MDNNKMREEFEAWALERFINSETMNPLLRDPEEPREYLYSMVNMAWVAWQASRAAVVIEPAWPYHHDYTNSDVAGAAVLDCRTAFQQAARAAGLKGKS
jgi:hypothetical protein